MPITSVILMVLATRGLVDIWRNGSIFAELREIKGDVRVILSSGYDEEEMTARFAQGDLAAFLQKPYTLKALETAIRSALEA